MMASVKSSNTVNRPLCGVGCFRPNTPLYLFTLLQSRRLFVSLPRTCRRIRIPFLTVSFLDVNPVYTKKIVGFEQEESDCILKFLFDHIAKRQDFSCRIRYEAGTVLVWDQRVTNHSQTLDYPIGDRRHGFRLTPLANKPIPAKIEEDEGN